jgi:hypothetical protein
VGEASEGQLPQQLRPYLSSTNHLGIEGFGGEFIIIIVVLVDVVVPLCNGMILE